MSANPYAAPRAAVADVEPSVKDGDFLPAGQGVGIGNAWPWITQAWRLFRKQPGVWIGGMITILIILVATMFIPYLSTALMAWMYPVFGAGLMVGAHALWKDEPMRFEHVFSGFVRRFGPLAVLGIVFAAASVGINMAVAVMAGLDPFFFTEFNSDMPPDLDMQRYFLASLLGLAVWIPVYMLLWFAPALIALNDLTPTQAMKASFLACLKNVLPFFLYSVLMFLLIFLSALALGLGLLITMPLSVISIYTSYRDIFYAD